MAIKYSWTKEGYATGNTIWHGSTLWHNDGLLSASIKSDERSMFSKEVHWNCQNFILNPSSTNTPGATVQSSPDHWVYIFGTKLWPTCCLHGFRFCLKLCYPVCQIHHLLVTCLPVTPACLLVNSPAQSACLATSESLRSDHNLLLVFWE